MSIDERLFALALQYRDRRGPAALGDTATFVAELSAQAPDLQGEIRALAAAFTNNAAGRISAAGNAELEEQAIAADIAAAQRLPRASTIAAVAVARRFGPVAVGAYAAPYPSAPASAPVATKSTWQNPWVLAAAGAVVLVIGYQQMQPAPPVPPAPPPDNQGPQAQVDPPALAPPDGPLPTLIAMPPDPETGLIGVLFKWKGKPGVLGVPKEGWEKSGMIGFFDIENKRSSFAGNAIFQPGGSDNKPARVVQVTWKRDEANMGPTCLAVIGTSGQEVVLSGSKVCMLSSSCDQTVACGRVP